MAASDHVSKKQMWHVARSKDRSSIIDNGIDYTKGESRWRSIKFPKGNYLFADEDSAYEYRSMLDRMEQDNGGDYDTHDVWHIPDFTGILNEDPFKDDESGLGKFSGYTSQPIPPDKIFLK